MGNVGLRDEHHSGRVFVQPVYDPRPLFASYLGQRGPERKKALDQRVRQVAWSGVDRDSSRFVDRHQVFVFEHYLRRFDRRLSDFRVR